MEIIQDDAKKLVQVWLFMTVVKRHIHGKKEKSNDNRKFSYLSRRYK